ncbi:MAG: DUF1848 domain-containing protein [Candidatus Omnitrophota bacterium]|nr:DUF1848 domain-containing protein [Candidatus Omnitrophota bacterium]
MKIISASRRTDIPAFYSEWFMNRIRAGYCVVPNPFNANQAAHVSLKPQDVQAIVFWTRNPKPIIKHLPELNQRGYRYYFQYTMIGYPKSIDPKSPPIDMAVKTFQELSGLIGKERVIWRYDPILYSNETPLEWHINQVSSLIEKLNPHTKRLVISFIDPYRKTKIRMAKEIGSDFHLAPDAFDASAYNGLIEWIGKEANTAGLEVQTCAEDVGLERLGIKHGKCIDDDLIRKVWGIAVSKRKDPSQRKRCGCVVSKDIGINNTCLFGCKYCYATSSIKAAENNFKKHSKNFSSLANALPYGQAFCII